MKRSMTTAVVLVLAVSACGPRIRPLQPVTDNGEIIRSEADEVIGTARAEGELERARLAEAGLLAPPPAECADAWCMADELLRQGDEYTAAGRLDLALERYDQADILRPDHAVTNLRLAQVLDKQLRPLEAVMRYRMFLHQMELERIRAHGEVAANVAEAIARAHERIVVLERR
jgi:tetratricopeptide (TPR) repeat protein